MTVAPLLPFLPMKTYIFSLPILLASVLYAFPTAAQDYQKVWSDHFNNTTLNPAIWSMENDIGIWNTGANQELQHYLPENITLGDDGQGNHCLILTAKKESTPSGYPFSSGKVTTKGKLAFQYGKLTARIKMPDIGNGLWPAFWLLGYTPLTWPASGEIDVVEMGHAQGLANGTPNKYFSGALHWQANNQRADYANHLTASADLTADYHTYTLEWTSSEIRMYLDDNAQPYFTMDITGADAEEFRDYPMYIILNLAVGGMLPDIYNESDITAPMPAKMYIDYIELYQQTPQVDSTLARFGHVDIYADAQDFTSSLILGHDATLHTQGLSARERQPYKGTEQLAYSINADNYSLSIQMAETADVLNMQNYTEAGGLSFYVATNHNQPMQVTLADATGQSQSVTIGNNSEYTFLTDDTWQKVAIPFSAWDALDFSQITTAFQISGSGANDQYIAWDEILWQETMETTEFLGILTEAPNMPALTIDGSQVHLYIWDQTLSDISQGLPFEGEAALAFQSSGGAGWYGFGIFSDAGVDLRPFSNGYLNLALKTSDAQEFWVGVGDSDGSEAKIYFQPGENNYGFAHDGLWHFVRIPVSDLTAQGINLASAGNVFMAGGSSISNIYFDQVFYSKSETLPETPSVNLLAGQSNDQSVTEGSEAVVQVHPNIAFADATYQWYRNDEALADNNTPALQFNPVSKSDEGIYQCEVQTEWGTALSEKMTLQVQAATGLHPAGEQPLQLYPNPVTQHFYIEQAGDFRMLRIVNMQGRIMHQQRLEHNLQQLDASHWPNGVYLLQLSGNQHTTQKLILKK